MIQALFLDADGVTLLKSGYFSTAYAKEYNVPEEKIMPFFKNEFLACQLGQKDMKEVLPPYLAQWGWEKSLDDFLMYWFKQNTVADEVVMEKVQEIRKSGIPCFLATDQEKYRAEYTRKSLDFVHRLDGCFFSCEVGFLKTQPDFFKVVINKLQVAPENICYFDDDQENLDAAAQTGIEARLYHGLKDLDLSLYGSV